MSVGLSFSSWSSRGPQCTLSTPWPLPIVSPHALNPDWPNCTSLCVFPLDYDKLAAKQHNSLHFCSSEVQNGSHWLNQSLQCLNSPVEGLPRKNPLLALSWLLTFLNSCAFPPSSRHQLPTRSFSHHKTSLRLLPASTCLSPWGAVITLSPWWWENLPSPNSSLNYPKVPFAVERGFRQSSMWGFIDLSL